MFVLIMEFGVIYLITLCMWVTEKLGYIDRVGIYNIKHGLTVRCVATRYHLYTLCTSYSIYRLCILFEFT